MKKIFFVLAVLFVAACAKKPSLNDADTEYIRTTVDLLKTRANFAVGEDSVHIKYSLDSVYRRHHTSAAEYRTQTVSLATDPKHAEAVFAAISDSISKK
ncbi:MAG TPA: hypothetical protein VFH95_01125 [Candidatus Kapabacteria bacterium]|nr:hypothetical protein [Candidatus Kapabacteria bacterium]